MTRADRTVVARASISMEDGIDPEQATAELIREEHDYSGAGVTLGGTWSRA